MGYIGNVVNVAEASGIVDGTITNIDINSNAAISLSKLDGINATATELNSIDMSASGSTSGQLLTSNGTGSAPTWQAAPQGVSDSKLFYFGSFN